MKAAGMLFLAKGRPYLDKTADGQQRLVLRAVHRISSIRTQAWTLFWTGPEAATFYAQHKDKLVGGTAVDVELDELRTHCVGTGPYTETHANVLALSIAPARWPLEAVA